MTSAAKQCLKPVNEQVDVVAVFHAHRISAERIAYRTGIALDFVKQLLSGESHQRLFKRRLQFHRRQRRTQQLQQSQRVRGIAQAVIQENIEKEFAQLGQPGD